MRLLKELIRNIFNLVKKKKKLSTILGIILVVVLIIIGRKVYLSTRTPAYETFSVTRDHLAKTIEVSGEIQAEESVDLHFQALGKLAWIGVKEGNKVNKWQAVASQDKRTLEKQLKQDLLLFEKEYRDYEQALEDNPLVSHYFKRILEKAQFDLDSEVIDVEIRNLVIELATLISPIEGIVTRVDTPLAGVNVTATDTITIVNPETIYFEAEVDESDIGKLQVGQKASIVLDAYEDETVSSEVYYVDFESSVSEGGGTVFLVKLKLPGNEGLKYRLGMSGDAEIILAEKKDALAVPFESVIERQGEFFVDVLSDRNRVERKEIEVGLVTDDYVEVISGLDGSEKVLFPQ